MNMIVSSASGKLAVRSDRVETDIWKYKKYTLVMDASNNMAWHIDGSYIKGIDTDLCVNGQPTCSCFRR